MEATANNPLRQARRRRGWTPDELAERAGVSAKTVRDIERERVAPRERTLFALADALEVTVDSIDPVAAG